MTKCMIYCMRATINIRDKLLERADEIAERLGVSRSKLFHDALERYLQDLQEHALTERMNSYLEKHGDTVDAGFQRYVARAWARDMGDDEW